MKNKKLLKLVIAALFTALTAVATAVIQIPLPLQGYFNIGDCFVLICGWTLGPLYGTIAAGLGSMIVDFALGYSHYAPGTFVIKACSALAAYLVFRAFGNATKKTGARLCVRILSGMTGEIIMVVGYFGYAALLLGNGIVAATGIPGNAIQGLVGIVLATAVMELLMTNKQICNLLNQLR